MAEETKSINNDEVNENDSVIKDVSDAEELTSTENDKVSQNTDHKSEKKNKKRESEAENLKLVEEILKLTAEKNEINNKYLRHVAEFENYKKRTTKEKDEIYAFANGEMLKQLLPVFDNLDRAKAVEDPEKLSEGIVMILRLFDEALAKLDIKEIESLGREFDPNLHEAIFHEDIDGEPENIITEVFQKGYMIGDKVIRHAMVKVIN